MFIINLVLALRHNTGAAQPPVRRPILALSNGDMTYGGCCTRRSVRLGIGCPASVMVFWPFVLDYLRTNLRVALRYGVNVVTRRTVREHGKARGRINGSCPDGFLTRFLETRAALSGKVKIKAQCDRLHLL